MTARSLLAQVLIGFGIGVTVLYVVGTRAGSLVTLNRAAHFEAQPVAMTEPESWDFGSVSAGQSLEAQFNVRNDGDRRLVLSRVNDGCDCTLDGQSTIMIEPGTERTIVANFDTTAFNGVCQFGLIYRTNDPGRPLLKFVCTAQIHHP